jgi:hypothetical protein
VTLLCCLKMRSQQRSAAMAMDFLEASLGLLYL